MDIQLGSVAFVEGARASIDSLFQPGATRPHWYKRRKRSIDFYFGGRKIATLNKWGVLASVTRLDDGREWFSFAAIEGVGCPIDAAKPLDVGALATRRGLEGRDFAFWYK